ncbi:MAG: ComF family protein [Bacteroidia bacterium]
MKKRSKSISNALFDLFFPPICYGCGNALNQNERCICSYCQTSLPKTNWQNRMANPLEKVFYGRVEVNRATSFLHFRKNSIVQSFLHNLKYNSQKELGVVLGLYFASDLKKASWVTDIEAVIPIPLHYRKLKTRGYNQSALLSYGIAKGLKIKHELKALQRVRFTETQTKKDRFSRQENVKGAFKCKQFKYQNVLLVDDVTTTGATFESAIAAIKTANPSCKINVATLAIAE